MTQTYPYPDVFLATTVKRRNAGLAAANNRQPAQQRAEPYGTILRSGTGCSSEQPFGWTLWPYGLPPRKVASRTPRMRTRVSAAPA
jgi:hypothetical protein